MGAGRSDGSDGVTSTSNDSATSEAAVSATVVEGASWTGRETVDDLRRLLEDESAEKIEMFEAMQAQIEYDRGYIQKLETGVETQRSMLEARDGELSALRSAIATREDEIRSLATELERREEEYRRATHDVQSYQTQVSQLTKRMSEMECTVTSLELESSFNEKDAREKERQLLQHRREWEEMRDAYERERGSLRKLAQLGAKRVGRGARDFLSRLRGKIIN